MYLSINIISNAILATNNRGETEGNLQTLQKVHTPTGTRTVLSGYAIKRAMRDSMQARGAELWRKTDPTPDALNPAGYLYGPQNVLAMKDAIPQKADEYDDTLLFGYMVAPKNDKENARKSRGNVEVTTAISTTSYEGDMSFVQGLKAAESQLNPFSAERHYTRYSFTLTINLAACAARPQAVLRLIDTLSGLRVGGNHGSNASEVTPDVISYVMHAAPGCGGLNIPVVNASPDLPVDVRFLEDRLAALGIKDAIISARPGDALDDIRAKIRAFYGIA